LIRDKKVKIKVNFYDTHEGQDKYEIKKIESIEEYYPFLKPL
jgi:hypothetical protein